MHVIDFSKYLRLPSLPMVAIEIVKLFHDPHSSNQALIAIVRKDPAIVVRLLKTIYILLESQQLCTTLFP